MTVCLNVVDREGVEHAVEAQAEGSLMEPLRAHAVAAVCGGMCSCATCHVYVAEEWHDRLPTPGLDEFDLLAGLSHFRPNSRLACRIPLAEVRSGLRLTVAPEE